jgi:hypothetical protein
MLKYIPERQILYQNQITLKKTAGSYICAIATMPLGTLEKVKYFTWQTFSSTMFASQSVCVYGGVI